jgi:hypothetical protein
MVGTKACNGWEDKLVGLDLGWKHNVEVVSTG